MTRSLVALQHLHRLEERACRAYRRLSVRLSNLSAAPELRRLAAEHRQAVTVLGQQIVAHGGRLIDGEMTRPGTGLALDDLEHEDALRKMAESERVILRSQQSALADTTIDTAAREAIGALLPKQRQHVDAIVRCLLLPTSASA